MGHKATMLMHLHLNLHMHLRQHTRWFGTNSGRAFADAPAVSPPFAHTIRLPFPRPSAEAASSRIKQP